tara:strand:+ start:910 stop:1278 length:369 start_codon:yes stop_codon:yes gene_type:complete
LKYTKPFNIPKSLVFEAFKAVKAKGGSAGVDEQSLMDYENNLKDNLYKLWNRLSSGSYFLPPVKEVEIPKKTGGKRVLGIPTVNDRIAQMVVKKILEPRSTLFSTRILMDIVLTRALTMLWK